MFATPIEVARPPPSSAAPAPSAAASPRLRPARADALGVLAGTLLTFGLASAFQWHEHLAALASRFERWQVDELPLALVALALGLAWFAARRRNETVRLLGHNRELARRLIERQESERCELARELHDELAQHCTAIRVETAYLRRCTDPVEVSAVARRVADAAALMQQDVRRLLRRLRPADLDELGLEAALASLAAAWQARTGIAVVLDADGALDRVDPGVATGAYRIAQEALTNVVRHAGASNVAVRLRAAGGAFTLSVTDDGRGFDPCRATRGLGLVGATERAAALAGTLALDSAPGRGTRLVLTVPRPEAPR